MNYEVWCAKRLTVRGLTRTISLVACLAQYVEGSTLYIYNIRNLGPPGQRHPMLLRVAKASRPAKEPQIISIWPCDCIS
jgi:hypothetical protein